MKWPPICQIPRKKFGQIIRKLTKILRLLTIARHERLEDLGYMAWSWCISSKASRRPIETQSRQVGILACEYGIDEVDRQNLFDSIVKRQAGNVQFWLERKENSNSESDIAKIRQMIEWTTGEHAYTVANRSAFRKSLA